MSLYELHTCRNGREIVRSTDARLRLAMYEYIKQRRNEGKSLGSIIFCWSLVRVSRSI